MNKEIDEWNNECLIQQCNITHDSALYQSDTECPPWYSQLTAWTHKIGTGNINRYNLPPSFSIQLYLSLRKVYAGLKISAMIDFNFIREFRFLRARCCIPLCRFEHVWGKEDSQSYYRHSRLKILYKKQEINAILLLSEVKPVLHWIFRPKNCTAVTI